VPYKLVTGEFHLFYKSTRKVGSQPDGDSMWFKPNNLKLLQNLDGRSAKQNAGGFVQLRFESIDSLELHFEASHQNLALAKDARDFTLDEAGFQTVTYSGSTGIHVGTATPHPIEGYILTRTIDPYGRPVSFVYAGKPAKNLGSTPFVDVKLLSKSINAKLAASGNAYPAYYTGLPTDLRNYISSLADDAKKHKLGVWKSDSSKAAATPTLAALEKLAVWPKLFRRLTSYFKDGNAGLAKFETWLRAKKDRDDEIWILSKGELGNLHDVVKINGNSIGMKYEAKDLIVKPG
jgi:hypothetical protein